MAAATSVLPLHCNICPKKPDFSDVSHLLTHIASKGHLSHYYKIKVRSGHDLAAKAVIDSYDQWYAHYNVEQLMSERMHLKDRKRPRQRAQAILSNTRRISQTLPTTVDPLLSNLKRDDSQLDHFQQLTSYPHYPPMTDISAAITPKLYKPPLALWRTSRPRSVISMIVDIPHSPPSPTMAGFGPGSGMAPLAQMWTKNTLAPLEDEEDGGSEATKLKGVYWPGMDIFDAATPEMKRKRNQKKDSSVAIQLERHSQFVEPTEMIFTPLGSLKKERVISGQADFDSSPDKLSPPTPKPKRRQSGRMPLAKRDSNVSSFPKRAPTVPLFPGYGPVNNSGTTQTGSNTAKKQTRKFEVFEDDNRQSLDNATNMRFLTSGFRPATHSAPDGRPLPSTLLDINTGAMYHNNLFAEAIEPFHPSFYGMPYYGHGYYGHTGIDFSGLFSTVQSHLANNQEGSRRSNQQPETAEDSRTVSASSDD